MLRHGRAQREHGGLPVMIAAAALVRQCKGHEGNQHGGTLSALCPLCPRLTRHRPHKETPTQFIWPMPYMKQACGPQHLFDSPLRAHSPSPDSGRVARVPLRCCAASISIAVRPKKSRPLLYSMLQCTITFGTAHNNQISKSHYSKYAAITTTGSAMRANSIVVVRRSTFDDRLSVPTVYDNAGGTGSTGPGRYDGSAQVVLRRDILYNDSVASITRQSYLLGPPTLDKTP